MIYWHKENPLRERAPPEYPGVRDGAPKIPMAEKPYRSYVTSSLRIDVVGNSLDRRLRYHYVIPLVIGIEDQYRCSRASGEAWRLLSRSSDSVPCERFYSGLRHP